MRAPSSFDFVSWYSAALLAGLATLFTTFLIGPWLVVLIGFGLQWPWQIVMLITASTPLALFIPFGAFAYRYSRGMRRAHVAAAYGIGAMIPLVYTTHAFRIAGS